MAGAKFGAQPQTRSNMSKKDCGCSEQGETPTYFEKLGRECALERLQESAGRALADFPTDAVVERLHPAARPYVRKTREVLETAQKAPRLSESAMEVLDNDLAWVRAPAEVFAVMLDNNSGGASGGGKSCRQGYNDCINEYDCDPDAWICGCCAACSIQYAKCLVTRLIETESLAVNSPNEVIA